MISLKNFLQRSWLCRQRQRQTLLLLHIHSDSVALSMWRQGRQLWYRESGFKPAGHNLQDALLGVEEICRLILLEQQAEENLPCLILLGKEYLPQEILTLPALECGELLRAARWEIERQYEWQPQSYQLEIELLQAAGQERHIKAVALPHAAGKALEQLTHALQLKLDGVLSDDAAFTVQERWRQGEYFRSLLPPQSWRKIWQKQLTPRDIKKLAACLLLLSMIICCGSKSAVYWAERQLINTGEQLKALEQWRQPYTESIALEQELTQAARLAAIAEGRRKKVSGEITAISKCLVQGCWLTALRQAEQGRGWQLTGRADDVSAVQQFLRRLERSDSFRQVGLQHSGGDKYQEFVITVQAKETADEK